MSPQAATEPRDGQLPKITRHGVVQSWTTAGKTAPPHLLTRPGDGQLMILARDPPGPAAAAGLCHGGETPRQLLRLTVAAHLVRQTQSMVRDHAPRAEPPQLPQQIRHVVVFPSPVKYFSRVVNNFLNAREVALLTVSIYRNTIPELREDQGVDQRLEHGRGQVPPQMR